MFGMILTVGCTALLGYVAWRASTVPLIERRVSRKALVAVALGLWTVLLLTWFYGHHETGPLALALELLGMTLLGVLFLVATATLAVDLVTGFGFLLPVWAPKLRGWAMIAGLVLATIALVQGLRPPVVSSHEVTLRGLPAELDGTVLVAISDTHLGAHRGERWFSKRAGEIRALHPDIVVLLGDVVEGHGDDPQEIPSLRGIPAPLGKWYVDGNHESHQGERGGADVLDRSGFHRLSDQWAEPAPGLVLAGVRAPSHHGSREGDGDPLGTALAGRPGGATILLSHAPTHAERASTEGVELMLAGHTHGGQVWPFGYVVRAVFPLVAGRYDVGGMAVIVCRGTGTWGPPMRLWRRSEILRIELRSW